MKIHNNKTVQHYAIIAMALAVASFSLILATKTDEIPTISQANQTSSQVELGLTSGEIEALCSLQDVHCDGEEDTKRIVMATVTTYQAVAGQTDSTPCSGAMGGVNFCKPPFPIVASNGYKLGTKVKIRGTVYTVADRMNRRFGSDTFDILTDGANYKLTNEPVEILTK